MVWSWGFQSGVEPTERDGREEGTVACVCVCVCVHVRMCGGKRAPKKWGRPRNKACAKYSGIMFRIIRQLLLNKNNR